MRWGAPGARSSRRVGMLAQAMVVVLAGASFTAACAGVDSEERAAGADAVRGDPSPGAAAGTGGTGADIVDQLVIAPEGSDDGYDRDLFDHWVDADGDGCDTRCEVLEAERRDDLPGLPSGGWLSIYDGYSTPDPSELDIDHVVALGEAWRSGADGWDAARREAFANDLADPQALVAVTAATNRSKGARDPAEWQPPAQAAWCEFATAWVTTKVRWGLTADQAESDALRNMLRSC